MRRFQQNTIKTNRLRTTYYRAGEGNSHKLLMLHGNLSSSVFFLPIFDKLAEVFDVVAPDLRGFGDSSAQKIDARRGYRDWSDDIDEFVDALGWDSFNLLGWSMGGGIGMQYVIDHGAKVHSLILVNPSSPYGFGGTEGVDGKMLSPPGIASGAGVVNPYFINAILANDRAFLRLALHRSIYFKPGFRLSSEWEDLFLDAVSKTRIGPGFFPGDVKWSLQWPFVVAGTSGVCNAMSSVYGNVTAILDVKDKPPILWIRGAHDQMISDRSICDMGVIRELWFVPIFPGAQRVPPQPMISQTRNVLDQYAKRGGSYWEIILDGAHCCWIESPTEFTEALEKFIL